MPVDINTPVTAMEGVGPRIAARLEPIGVRTVLDLLRGTTLVIHSAVREIASEGEVRAWREMAALLQVAGMTPQWAEALHKGGVPTISLLRTQTVARLDTLFADARTRGIIPNVPDNTTLVATISDAIEIHFTGMLVGTVLDAGGRAVSGAMLEIGTQSTKTDARGRFRLIRIPLGTRRRLSITCDGFASKLVGEPPVACHGDFIRLERYELAAAAPRAAARLDEFEGAVLPPLTDSTMVTERREIAALREGDVLVLHKILEGGDALVATKFFAYEAGRFIVYTWRLPADRLPAHAAVRDCFLLRDGTLKKVRHGRYRMRALLRLRRLRREFRGRPSPQTVVEYDEALRARGQFLRTLSEE